MSDRKQPLCDVVSLSGTHGEPLACGYLEGHDLTHSWASLPTFVNGRSITELALEQENATLRARLAAAASRSGELDGLLTRVHLMLDETSEDYADSIIRDEIVAVLGLKDCAADSPDREAEARAARRAPSGLETMPRIVIDDGPLPEICVACQDGLTVASYPEYHTCAARGGAGAEDAR